MYAVILQLYSHFNVMRRQCERRVRTKPVSCSNCPEGLFSYGEILTNILVDIGIRIT